MSLFPGMSGSARPCSSVCRQ